MMMHRGFSFFIFFFFLFFKVKKVSALPREDAERKNELEGTSAAPDHIFTCLSVSEVSVYGWKLTFLLISKAPALFVKHVWEHLCCSPAWVRYTATKPGSNWTSSTGAIPALGILDLLDPPLLTQMLMGGVSGGRLGSWFAQLLGQNLKCLTCTS